MAKAVKLAEDVFEKRGLIIRPSSFACPYCGRSIHRGGKAEGFRKAGMSHHVYNCWEIGVYLRGYFVGEYTRGPRWGQRAIPIAEAQKADWHRRVMRSMGAAIRKRRKDGELDHLMPKTGAAA